MNRTLLLLASLAACPGHASEVWNWQGFTITAMPDDACAARLVIYNAWTDWPDEPMPADVSIDGLAIALRILHGSASTPDVVEVFPPPGMIAIPPVVSIPEEDSATVLICEAGVS